VSRDVQPPEHSPDATPDPAADLLAAIREAAPRWFRRIVAEAARNGGVDPSTLDAEIDRLLTVEVPRIVDTVGELLTTDVDEQRTNPLSVFRAAIVAPTALLRDAGVAPPPPDPFAADAFPDDVYQLGPASWADIDPALHEPGLVWGAWKAITVLRRRRDEGLR
jgi:hypothetical protein